MMIKMTALFSVNFLAENMMQGQCFMRPTSVREPKGLYMRIGGCGAVRRLDSVDDRTIPIINLRTGTLFFIYATETVIPLDHAIVVSDSRT